MKKFLMICMVGAAITASAGARAWDGEDKVDVDREALALFCEDKAPPKKGFQPNGQKADSRVTKFLFGDYYLGDRSHNIYLNIYSDGSFHLTLSQRSNVTYGTDGDDLISDRVVAGCSREQLSEALCKNDVLDRALKVVPEDSSLAEEAAQ